MQALYRNGSFAEYTQYPVESISPIIGERIKKIPIPLLAKLNRLCVSYGAVLNAEMHSGAVVAVAGATGGLGSGCVAIALALGASKVYAIGRDHDALETLQKLNPKRVIPLKIDQDFEAFSKIAKHVIGNTLDVYFDALGVTQSTELTELGLSLLRYGGTAVFLGGVQAKVPVVYGSLVINNIRIQGSFMHSAAAPSQLIALIDSEILDISYMQYESFTLENIMEGIEMVEKTKGKKKWNFSFPTYKFKIIT